jgi:uncharacterized protein
MEAFVSFIVKHLVSNPDAVKVTAIEEASGRTTYRIEVDPADLGPVIGREGKTAGALRTLLMAAGARQGKRVAMEIVDPARPPKRPAGD